MNKLVKIEDPHYHHLELIEGSVSSPQTCHKCRQPVSRDYYKCRHGFNCEYYLHNECTELKDLPRKRHPLHPQHPLAIHDKFPYVKSFVCSFCGKHRQSRQFYQCTADECNFYLDVDCNRDFIYRPELLKKYEIQHFFHDHENHQLSPHIPIIHEEKDDEYEESYVYSDICDGCGDFTIPSQEVYKCTGCAFYLHTECSQVPKEVQHYSHPHHPLVLLHNLPPWRWPPAAHHDYSNHKVRCIVCLKWIRYEFYVHCTHCPIFNLDLQCYFRAQIRPTMKHETHEHPLEYFWQIYDYDARCYACNTPCERSLYCCFTCNFKIHSDCLALPITVNSDDHVHPLTLTSSFKEYDHPTAYYCDICEKRRDPDHGLYLCKECPFMAHFECALSLTTTEEKEHKHAPWRQKIKDDNHKSDENQEDMTLTNEKVSLEIFDQLNVEIKKLGEAMRELIIEKREGEHLTEKIQEFDERHKNTEDMLRRLKQSVTECTSFLQLDEEISTSYSVGWLNS